METIKEWTSENWNPVPLPAFSASSYLPLHRQRRICDVCENEFIPRTKQQKRCSPECSAKAIERRKKRGAWFIFNRDKFRCIYCGKSAYEDEAKLHADHIIPKSAGGSTTAANLVTACARCNHEKNTARVLDEASILAEAAHRNEAAGIDPELTIKLRGLPRRYK